MTKNRTMRVAVLLLALTLITSCFVGGTFAKYITETSSSDNARVAVWGINADGVTMDLFDSSYDETDVTVSANFDAAASGYDNLIAPGTAKESKFSIVNTTADFNPEVDYTLKIDLTGSEIDQSILDNANIQWALDDNEYGTWDEMMTDILQLVDADAVYEAGTTVSATAEMDATTINDNFADGEVHTITWRWVFDETASGYNSSDDDTTDTAMGNAAAEGDLNVALTVAITATQVD